MDGVGGEGGKEGGRGAERGRESSQSVEVELQKKRREEKISKEQNNHEK